MIEFISGFIIIKTELNLILDLFGLIILMILCILAIWSVRK